MQSFVDELRREMVVAVVRAPHYGDGRNIAEALREGGVRLVEFTFSGSNVLDAIERASRAEGVIVGAGTVRDVASARRAVDAGAQFIVCPAEIADVATAITEVPVVLAGLTPSEVLRAHLLTGGPVKVFPASAMGPSYIRAIRAPLPDIPLVPSGGIDASNLGEYLGAGAIAVNIGTPLCPVDAVTTVDATELTRRAALVRAATREFQDG